MICDGAKPSCAAKIASAVDAGLMGYHMYQQGGHQFVDGEGIIRKGVENTIGNVGRLAPGRHAPYPTRRSWTSWWDGKMTAGGTQFLPLLVRYGKAEVVPGRTKNGEWC